MHLNHGQYHEQSQKCCKGWCDSSEGWMAEKCLGKNKIKSRQDGLTLVISVAQTRPE